MSDMADTWRELREARRANRRRLGIDCPGCPIIQPKRIPTRLMPGQRCRVCGHQDRRPRPSPLDDIRMDTPDMLPFHTNKDTP